MLEASLDALPDATALLEEVLGAALFTAAELPAPSDVERRGPGTSAAGEMPLFEAAGIEIEAEPSEDE